VKADEIAERDLLVETHVRAERDHGVAQRHVLEVRLVGAGAPLQEELARVRLLRAVVRVVVRDLMVVPRHDPRARGVRGL
jgi:hypothetical protein